MTLLLETTRPWSVRPADAQYHSLDQLTESIQHRKSLYRELEQVPVHRLKPTTNGDDNMVLEMPSGLQLGMTHWSFDQLCKLGKAPTEYMRRIPTFLACMCVQTGLVQADDDQQAKVLFSTGLEPQLHALTSTGYGRVWDSDVLDALTQNLDDDWSVDHATLSDRDMYMFLINKSHPVDIDGKALYRGFYLWNSEVGASTLGIAPYLSLDDTHILWGGNVMEQLRIRHTVFAPERFMHEAKSILRTMSDASESPILHMVDDAKRTTLAKNSTELSTFLTGKPGFSKSVAKELVAHAETIGEPTCLWTVVRAGSELAKRITYTDERLSYEGQVSDLLSWRDVTEEPDPEEVIIDDEWVNPNFDPSLSNGRVDPISID